MEGSEASLFGVARTHPVTVAGGVEGCGEQGGGSGSWSNRGAVSSTEVTRTDFIPTCSSFSFY